MLRVLLIEDNPGDALLIKCMLEEVGRDNVRLESSVDRISGALALLAEHPFDVVLADLSLPDAYGLESVTRLLAQAPEIPIVVLTGTDDGTVAVDAVRTGAQDYLVKGQVNGELLFRSLSYAVERKRTTLEEQRYLRTLASLSRAAMGFVELDPEQNIYQYIGQQLRELVGDAGIAVSSFNSNTGAFTIESTPGLEQYEEGLTNLFGPPPWVLSMPAQLGHVPAISSGKLVKLSGLYELLLQQYDEQLCRQMEAHAEISEVYAAGFTQKTGLLGSVAILMRHGSTVKDISALEIFINLAAVALQRRQMEQELRHLSVIDPLTGLYNRRGFFTLAEQQLRIAGRTRREMLLLFMDMDNLKWINDALGHQLGDTALMELATFIKETFRASDILARIGGDEFVALVIDAREGDAELMQRRLQERLAASTCTESLGFILSVSTGYAYFDPFDCCSIDDLLRRADSIMYEQKRSKRKVLP